jgi:hypothetical protein
VDNSWISDKRRWVFGRKKVKLSTGYPQVSLTYPQALYDYPQVICIVENLSTVIVENLFLSNILTFYPQTLVGICTVSVDFSAPISLVLSSATKFALSVIVNPTTYPHECG